MDQILKNIEKQFPFLSKKIILNIYKDRFERLRVLMQKGIPNDVRFIIEAKVRIAGEFTDLPTRNLPGLEKSSYSKKRRAKQMQVCHKCARWTCNTRCRSLGMVSNRREDKIQFIKDGLSKESLDDIQVILESHPSGNVQIEILRLWKKFQDEYEHRLGNLTLKDSVCQFIRKLDGKHIPDA